MASTGEHSHLNIKLWLQGHLLVLVVKDSTNSIGRLCVTVLFPLISYYHE